MRKSMSLPWVGLSAALLFGCSAARDVEVTGEVTAASSGIQGPIVLEFLDLVDREQVPEIVHTQTLAALGAFTATAPLEGDRLRIRAIDDRDEDGACTNGEDWAEVDADVENDEVTGVKLVLGSGACPAPGD